MSWDKETVYDNEIAPLMTKIIEICKREQIPLVATFHLASTEAGVAHCVTVLVRDGEVGAVWPHTSELVRRLSWAHQPDAVFEVFGMQPEPPVRKAANDQGSRQ